MYDVEKHSAVLENAAGFVRLDRYIYSLITKLWPSIVPVRNRLTTLTNAR